MKLEQLPIWPRILAAKPHDCKAARPINILRAVIAAGGIRHAGPTRTWGRTPGPAIPERNPEYYSLPTPRSKRWTQAQRDEKRAANDKRFARVLARKKALEATKRALVMHIAERWHATVKVMYTSRYASITWGRGTSPNVEWDRYAKSYKFPCKYSDAGCGVIPETGQVVLSPVNGKEVFLPPLPAGLLRAWAPSEPHPVGLFAVPIKGQVGVFACMSAKSGDKKWTVSGFAVAGHLVPECVARGTTTLDDIRAEGNAESKRIMVERFGFGRYLTESGAQQVQEDEFGRLYELPGGTKLARLLNSTPNPDGTINEYFLPVPSNCATAHEAVAWSFGCTADTYRPVVQS